MAVKWNKIAIQQLLEAVTHIEETGSDLYARALEKDILVRIRELVKNPDIYPVDKYRKKMTAATMLSKWIVTGYHTEIKAAK
jgi:hypothetical protein